MMHHSHNRKKGYHRDTEKAQRFLRQFFSPCFLCVSVVFIFLALSSCDDPKTTDATDSMPADSVTPAPKKDTLVSADTFKKTPIDSPRKYNGPVPEVAGTVYYNLPYCGGARPSQELIAKLREYKPLTACTLLLKNKSGSYKITTDANGKFSASVPEGAYEVFFTENVNKAIYNVDQENCYNCLTEFVANVTLKANTENVIKVSFRCGLKDRRRP